MTQMENIRWSRVQPGDVIVSGPHGGGSDVFFTIERPLPLLTASQAIRELRDLETIYVDAWDTHAYDADAVKTILDRAEA